LCSKFITLTYNYNDLVSNSIIADRKRYIQGYETHMTDSLWEYTDDNVSDFTSIHIDDIRVLINNTLVQIKEQTISSISGTLGNNYYIEAYADGKVEVSSTRIDSDEAVCIGGFHYGRIRLSTTASDVTIGIIPNSVWTLKWMPNCKCVDAMVYIGENLWGDIYLTRIKTSSPKNSEGGEVYESSAFGALPGTGTEGFSQYTFTETLCKVGKRLCSNDEFVRAADGAPVGLDGSNTNAWTATSNTSRTTCGNVAYSVSLLNICDLVGNVYKWCRDKYELNNGGTTTYAWHLLGGTKGDVYGPGSYGLGALGAGGNWSYGAHCGSRCVNVYYYPWNVDTDNGAWAVADGV
jgi:hypothetical protein